MAERGERRVVLVTGAGTDGIGRAVVRRIADPGTAVAIHCHGARNGADMLAREATGRGTDASVHPADFTAEGSGRALVEGVVARHGRLDALVHCAAATVRRPAMETTTEDLDRLLAVNVRGTFEVIRATAAHLLARGAPGRIVIVSSVNQQLVVPGQVAYSATKGAVMQMAKTFALELARTGIAVNLVAPGTIETDLNRHLLADPAFRALREGPIPMGRVGLPAEVAGAVAYLLSEEARYVTGATLAVDGGLSLP
ncbi:MAG: SDR family NAD(P)-dependent oxidoreductase [Rhodospirillales bacterium]|jgi:NAD(P)-dependent dehydrogenase (short-subunit alcohol dehydrogenase family)